MRQACGIRAQRDDRAAVYRFVTGGPVLSPTAWKAALQEGQFTGTAELACADGSRVAAQLAATIETVTGRQLVLFVALSTSRWGARFRRTESSSDHRDLSGREREIVQLVALGNTGPEIADQLQIAHDWRPSPPPSIPQLRDLDRR